MSTERHSRAMLPIPDRRPIGLTTYDAKDPATSFPPIEPLRPPTGAPNVLVVLLDDVGFGASSAFGGPCHTPTFERLASDGLKYTRFHTTALCSPTRAALLSGRNHHSVGMGGITEIATSAPGYSSIRSKDKAPMAEILKLNGYATAHFGKCHEVPVWETSPMGPFDRWPSPGNGFEHFYGFIGVSLAAQVMFLTIAADPARYRPMMIAAILEKLSFGTAVWLLWTQGRVGPDVLFFASLDLIWGALFTLSFLRGGAEMAGARR